VVLHSVRVHSRLSGPCPFTPSPRSLTSVWAAGRSGTPSIVGPRFLASAFAAGPALIILSAAGDSTCDGFGLRGGDRDPSRQADPALATGRAATNADIDLLACHLTELSALTPEQRTAALAGATVFDVEAGDVLLKQGRDGHACVLRSSPAAWW
jgi:hypothetical protein